MVVCWGGGLNKYHGAAPDCLQRPLLRRSRFRQQVSASVRLQCKTFRQTPRNSYERETSRL